MFSTPNMKDIHDKNLSFFSPQPYFIAAFFFPQQLFQLVWLYKLCTLKQQDSSSSPSSSSQAQQKSLNKILPFVPYYTLGNICIGTWLWFWNAEQLTLANIFVLINSSAQIFFITTQQTPLDRHNPGSVLTHIVSKTFAGIGVLDALHNTSVAFCRNAVPTTAVKVLTGVGFGGAALGSDWIFGGCLVYDLVALSVGQRRYDGVWSRQLGFMAAGTAAIVGIKNFLR
jgi:hypothetical protein